MLLPQLLFVRSLGGNYKGIPRFVDNDAWYYLARARDVADGYTTLGNPYLAEHKDKPAFQFFIPDWLEVQAIKLFGADIPEGFLVLIPLFGFLNAILGYVAAWRLTHSRFAAVCVSAFIFLGLFGKTFNRPTSPSFTILFWFLEFYALLAFVQAEKKTRKLYLANILALGMLFHVYPYFWSFYITVIGTIFLVRATMSLRGAEGDEATPWHARLLHFARNDRMLSLKHLLVILSGAAVIAIPYFMAFWQSAHLPEYSETLLRFGVLKSHFPAGIRVVVPGVMVLLAALALWWRKILRSTPETMFVMGGVAGAVIVINQHVITGTHFEPSLHYADIGLMWIVFAVAYLAVIVVRQYPKIISLVAGAGILAIVGAFTRYTFVPLQIYANASNWEKENQRLAAPLQWLEAHAIKDDVVFANARLSSFIPVYTPANVLYDRNANLFFIRTQEAQERFLINTYFENIDEAFIRTNERSLFGVRYTDVDGQARQENKIRNILGLAQKPLRGIPQPEIERVLQLADEVKRQPLETWLKKYHVRWFLVDGMRDGYWQAAMRLTFLEPAAMFDEQFSIYRMK